MTGFEQHNTFEPKIQGSPSPKELPEPVDNTLQCETPTPTPGQ